MQQSVREILLIENSALSSLSRVITRSVKARPQVIDLMNINDFIDLLDYLIRSNRTDSEVDEFFNNGGLEEYLDKNFLKVEKEEPAPPEEISFALEGSSILFSAHAKKGTILKVEVSSNSNHLGSFLASELYMNGSIVVLKLSQKKLKVFPSSVSIDILEMSIPA